MFAETLAGIALVKSSVSAIKSAIGTAKDVSEIADQIDNLFLGEKQIQKKKIKKQQDPFSVGSVARETIDAKLAQEQMYEVKQLVNLRFGHGTWEGIIAERARRIQEQREAEKAALRKKQEQQETMIIAASLLAGLLVLVGIVVAITMHIKQ